jgi:hypothetical protein
MPAPFGSPPRSRAAPLAGAAALLTILAGATLWLLRAPDAQAPAPPAVPPPRALSPSPAGPTPPPAVEPAPALPQGRLQVFKCRLPDGTVRYSDEASCEGVGTPLVIDAEANLMAGERRRPAAPPPAPPPGPAIDLTPRAPPPAAPECGEITREIADLDAAARQPQTAAGQQQLRERRHALRARQFALRCP